MPPWCCRSNRFRNVRCANHELDIGEVVALIAAVRDEDTSGHYAPPNHPVVADCTLLSLLVESLEEEGIEPHIGLVTTTSSTFTEGLEWANKWGRMGGTLCRV